MSTSLRLMAVFAHPDDESLGTGGTLAMYAAEGIGTHLVTATRGERGWFGPPDEYPGSAALGRIREAELRAAAETLGVHEVTFLNYVDGEVDRADPVEAVARIVKCLRRARPHVVITFGPDGVYGHPDHIAISQLTTAAVVCAADASYDAESGIAPHRTAKLYYRVWTAEELAAYSAVFGEPVLEVDGQRRAPVGWPDWAISTRLDTRSHWRTVWRAVACHRSQLPTLHQLEELDDEAHERLWGPEGYYRAMSTVNGGRAVETDLFAGLR